MWKELPCLFSGDSHQVGARAEQRRFTFDFANGVEQSLALLRITPQALELRREPARAFHGQQLQEFKSARHKLLR